MTTHSEATRFYQQHIAPGPPSLHAGNAIWDDGEWISWDEINAHIQDLDEESALEMMIALAKFYYSVTYRHLPIYGEMGEFYAERRYELDRLKPGTSGADARMGDDFVEIKTITPFKKNKDVRVKTCGNFNKLIVVKIDQNHQIDSRIIERKHLPKTKGKYFKVSWEQMKPDN